MTLNLIRTTARAVIGYTRMYHTDIASQCSILLRLGDVCGFNYAKWSRRNHRAFLWHILIGMGMHRCRWYQVGLAGACMRILGIRFTMKRHGQTRHHLLALQNQKLCCKFVINLRMNIAITTSIAKNKEKTLTYPHTWSQMARLVILSLVTTDCVHKVCCVQLALRLRGRTKMKTTLGYTGVARSVLCT